MVAKSGLTGYSLLELMLTIVIIAIMVSLLVASLHKAKTEAQRVSCRVAIRSYALEYSESQGRLMIVIPQEANCHNCHMPRYDTRQYLDALSP